MSGVKVEVEFSAREIKDLMQGLLRAGADMSAVYTDMGEALLNSHHDRWADEEDAEGNAWEPLSATYQARKKKNANKILVLDSYMHDTLAYNADMDGLELGTNRIYGATHQFGDDKRNIPARPFLGLSADDEDVLGDIIRSHFLDAMNRI